MSSSMLAISVLRKDPEIKILIIERDQEFKQKVGESTSDITALFFRRFEIDHILKKHVQKTGLRFFFNENNSPNVDDVSEFSSPTYDGPNNGFQINRKEFDEQLLQEAVELGAVLYRPAEIINSTFEEFQCHLDIRIEGGIKKVSTKWFVDASGRARYIHQKMGWKDQEVSLNTGAIFAHFKDIKPTSEWKLKENTYWNENAVGDGSYATLHFMREHSWWWLIRIDDRTTSIGYVFDKNTYEFEDAERFFLDKISEDAQLNSILEGAEHTSPVHVEKVPYQSEKLHEKGVALIGDAGAFVDPMVSPGIELICQQVLWLSELLHEDIKKGRYNERKWRKYERLFEKAYRHRMDIYKNQYRFMNSYDLSSNWLQLGLLAYFGIFVFFAFLFPKRLKIPFTIHPIGRIGYWYMVWRLGRIDKKRKRQNRDSNPAPNAVTYSSFYYPTGIFFYTIPLRMFFKWLFRYLKLELKELRHLFK